MKSIRHELSFRLLVGASLLLVAAGLVLGILIHSRLLGAFDHTLETKARALAALTSLEGRYLEFDFSEKHMPEFSHEEEPEYFELRLRDGRVIARSGSLGDGGLPAHTEPAQKAVFRNVSLPDGRDGRLVHLAVSPVVEMDVEDEGEVDDEVLSLLKEAVSRPRPVVIITVARSRGDLDALLYSLYGTLGTIDVLVLLGIGLLTRNAINHGLQPIAAMNRQVMAIGPDALDRRVQLEAPPEELRTILQAINALMDRLQGAFERERRFSSNVAHELRTPVAELRTATEVGARWPDDPESVRGLFNDIREIALQMETVVTHMLLLSRCENRNEAVTRTAVMLDSVVRTCWERTSANAAARSLQFESSIEPDGIVNTDGEKLGMIVQNLLDNAVSYGAPESVVRCFTAKAPTGVDLVIENDVENVTPADLQRVFEPFWRKDPARSASNHAGLGLSIARALCDILEIGLRVDLQAERRFVVRLSFSAMPTA